MTTCVIRTVIIYILLILAIRITGKRQIGELEISELVSTILISEIASLPIGNQEIPLTFAIIPILLIISMEIIISYSSMQSPIFKKIFLGTPSILVCRGKLQPKEMKNARVSIEELMSQLRQNGVTSLEEVDYAILENNGKLSVVPHTFAKPVTVGDLNLSVDEAGIAHSVVVDRHIKYQALSGAGKSEQWLRAKLKEKNLTLSEILLLSVDDLGKIYVIKKE